MKNNARSYISTVIYIPMSRRKLEKIKSQSIKIELYIKKKKKRAGREELHGGEGRT